MVDAELREYVSWLAGFLRGAGREGAAVDEPEGARFVTMSDTLAEQIATTLMRLLNDA